MYSGDEVSTHPSWMYPPTSDIPTLGGVGDYPPSERTWYQRYPPPCGQTDTCENITFLQLRLRAVNIAINDGGEKESVRCKRVLVLIQFLARPSVRKH